MKKALITGITGQDGSYLAEQLLAKGYEVHGIVRRSSSFNTARINHLYDNPEVLNKTLFTYYGDVVDASSLNRLLEKIGPDEIYNLAAQSHVKVSFEIPDYTGQVDALGTLRFLDAIRETGLERQTRFYQASTSELFGQAAEVPQNEKTPFQPRSPYAVAKLYAYWIAKTYREAYNVFACNGILFNHESPRRGETFVSRKITLGLSRLILGVGPSIMLGNLEAKRDWGYAPEYCEGMWKMLQYQRAEDFVLATNESHSVREFVKAAASYIGIEIDWKKDGEREYGYVKEFDEGIFHRRVADAAHAAKIPDTLLSKKAHMKKGDVLAAVSETYFRPAEVDFLQGDYSQAKAKIGWEPNVKFKELIAIMMDADLRSVAQQLVG